MISCESVKIRNNKNTTIAIAKTLTNAIAIALKNEKSCKTVIESNNNNPKSK